MQANDQHRTKLLFSSKLCPLYIQPFQPAVGARPFLSNPAASHQLRERRDTVCPLEEHHCCADFHWLHLKKCS